MKSLDTLEVADFKTLLNQTFTLTGVEGGDTLEVKLTEAEPVRSGVTKDSKRAPFCLVFSAAPGTQLQALQLYSITNENLGTLDPILLSVVQPSADGSANFEAIFN